MGENAIAIVADSPLVALDVRAVREQVDAIQRLMKDIMHRGEHYGIIPGTDKPTLMKPGAEKLAFTFRLLPRYTVTLLPVDGMPGHREYQVGCSLTNASGAHVADGLGTCSTMESKYRYRADYEVLADPIPRDAKERKSEYRKQGFGMKKVDGEWKWVKYREGGKQENTDIADVYNTVLKMAKKRAFVDAVITACAASDIFTQDMEDGQEESAPASAREKVVSEAEADRTAEGEAMMPSTRKRPSSDSWRAALLADMASIFKDGTDAEGKGGFFSAEEIQAARKDVGTMDAAALAKYRDDLRGILEKRKDERTALNKVAEANFKDDDPRESMKPAEKAVDVATGEVREKKRGDLF